MKTNSELTHEDLVGAKITAKNITLTICEVLYASKYWRNGMWDIQFVDEWGKVTYWKQDIDGGYIVKE